VTLVAEALGKHIDRGYVYFAMAFSFGVEILNLRVRRARAPVKLHGRFEAERPPAPPPAEADRP
jgi:predicted tellurium resistance membrane protein TerC